MSQVALLKVAPVYSSKLVLDPALRRETRTLYGSLEQLPDQELPLLANHDPGKRIGTVRKMFRHPDVDGDWHAALVDVDDPPPTWLKVGTPVSFKFVTLSRTTAGGCETITRGLMLEVSVLSPGVEPAEPRARVATLERSSSPASGSPPAGGTVIRHKPGERLFRRNTGRILQVR